MASQYTPLDASHLYDLSHFYHTTSHQCKYYK
jgi:hypothetical protein